MRTPTETRLFKKIVEVCLTVSKAMLHSLDFDQLVYVILASIARAEGLNHDRGVLFLADEKGRELKAYAALGSLDRVDAQPTRNEDQAPTRLLSQLMTAYQANPHQLRENPLVDRLKSFVVPVTSAISSIPQGEDQLPLQAMVAHCAVTKKPFFSNSVQAVFEPPPAPGGEPLHFQHMATLPLVLRSSTLGVLLVDNTLGDREMLSCQVEGLTILANLATVVIEKARLNRRLEETAWLDGLTGTYDRRHFEARLDLEIERAKRADKALTIMIFYIHRFDEFNQIHGYPRGDQVLKDLADLLREGVRTEDIITRYGQSEFLIMLTGGPTREEASKVAEKIISRMGSHRLGGLEPGDIQVSGALAWLPAEGLARKKLSGLVEDALEQATREMSGRIALLEPGLSMGV